MAKKSFELVVEKVPAWVGSGLNIEDLANDALESIGNELERRQGRGLGARVNRITRVRNAANLEQRVLSTKRTSGQGTWPNHANFNPRVTGRSWQLKGESRFRGMAPRSIKKYITEPLRAAWSKSRTA